MKYSNIMDKRIRYNFGKHREMLPVFSIDDIQILSYKRFISDYVDAEGALVPSRLSTILQSIFPIENAAGNTILEFVDYFLEEPLAEEFDCLRNMLTYAYQLRMGINYKVYTNPSSDNERVLITEEYQSIYLGEIPKMTDDGIMIINGHKKVMVNQLSKSAGILFYDERNKSEINTGIHCRFIPSQGSWLDISLDAKHIIYARIDKKRKFPVTALLLALGYSKRQIISYFYNIVSVISITSDEDKRRFILDISSLHVGSSIPVNVYDHHNNILLRSYDIIDAPILAIIKQHNLVIDYPIELILNSHFVNPIIVEDKVLVDTCDFITMDSLETLRKHSIDQFEVMSKKYHSISPYCIARTMEAEHVIKTQADALFYIYQTQRNSGDYLTTLSDALHVAQESFLNTFFQGARFSLSEVGRFKLNSSLNNNSTSLYLTKDDIFFAIKKLVDIFDGLAEADDIDHLGNRRLRTIGEHLEQQMCLGLYRMEKNCRDLLKSTEYFKFKPKRARKDLLNAKPLIALIRSFFNQGELSQFLDQVNPLSEIAHKRRLTALGPGGLLRDRASFEVRDINPSHYGRICTIESPEGGNIGLISYLASYATINRHGFLITPYRKVINSTITDTIEYLDAHEEERFRITSTAIDYDKHTGKILVPNGICRYKGSIQVCNTEDIDYVDISPKQMISISASLIPFIDHDDAKRSLMGSNMQRQAVPILMPQAPLIGTGMESAVTAHSGTIILAKRPGKVIATFPDYIAVLTDSEEACIDIYNLKNFIRSNKKTCIHQRAVVKIGDLVLKGDLLADGACSDMGELALGSNIMIAIMPLEGYNFEDSIVISDTVLEKELFTSIHIEEFTCISRATKLGDEEITSDIPGIASNLLSKLDEFGIIRVGTQVKAGDILVGKITPKTQEKLTPEDKLLRAIFGDKSSEVDDSSLRAPYGISGTVIDVKIIEGDSLIESNQRELELENHVNYLYKYLAQELRNAELADGSPILVEKLSHNDLRESYLRSLQVSNKDLQHTINTLLSQIQSLESRSRELKALLNKKKMKKDLGNGVLKIIKVSIAMRFQVQAGDKLAGRHGNKGIISKILPREDMPYTADGQVIDMVLTPLGIPSRMNIGQILEATLGLISVTLGNIILNALESPECSPKLLRDKLNFIYNEILHKNSESCKEDFSRFNDAQIIALAENLKHGLPFATPCFDGAKEADLISLLHDCNLDKSGKIQLYNGKTSEPFDNMTLVGVMYFLKLDHLVNNKMHARSTGSYSLITKQPLGGRAQFGGQRFGEMEVWAVQAYGASYILQEMLTIKSDDIEGRNNMYKNIIAGNLEMKTDIPSSFNVLLYELKSLGLNIEFLVNENNTEEKI